MTSSTDPAAGEVRSRERNPRGQGGRLRSEIVAAAAALLDETGTEQSVTLRAVARRAGITAPAIYGHFADRDQILLAVVQEAFAELGEALHAAVRPADDPDPVGGLRAVCTAYLDFAAAHPQRYRAMFGGLWIATDALAADTVSTAEVSDLGREALAALGVALEACTATGHSTSTDIVADVVALWLGLHGLAHQRAVTAAFPWPADIADRLISALAHLRT